MNGRVKNYFDLSMLLGRETLDANLLAQAIEAAFERCGMKVRSELPVASRTDSRIMGRGRCCGRRSSRRARSIPSRCQLLWIGHRWRWNSR